MTSKKSKKNRRDTKHFSEPKEELITGEPGEDSHEELLDDQPGIEEFFKGLLCDSSSGRSEGMGNKFYLIQRGQIRTENESFDGFFGPSQGRLVNPDYMGSSEFEFGAIPAAYTRIRYHYKSYKLFATPFISVDGRQLFLFCDLSFYQDIIDALTEYIENGYHTKEATHLRQHFQMEPDGDFSRRMYDSARNTDFWWCIDRNRLDESGSHIGDWVAFFGDDRIREEFNRIIEADYEEFMTQCSPEEREERYQLASSSRYR